MNRIKVAMRAMRTDENKAAHREQITSGWSGWSYNWYSYAEVRKLCALRA